MGDIFSIYTVLWGGWIAYFIIVEAIALKQSNRGTLSAQVWAIIGVGTDEQGSWHLSGRRILFLAFWAWLTVHFFFRWV